MINLTYNDITLQSVGLSDYKMYRDSFRYAMFRRRTKAISVSKNNLRLGCCIVEPIANTNVYWLTSNVGDDYIAEVINAVSYWLFSDRPAEALEVTVRGNNKEEIIENIENSTCLSKLKDKCLVFIRPPICLS